MVIEQLKQSSQVCTGCSACYSICPVNAISMENDQENFRSPVIQMYSMWLMCKNVSTIKQRAYRGKV